MEKIYIDRKETDRVEPVSSDVVRETAALPHPISLWTKVAIGPLVLLLPVLCLVTLVMRIAMRGLPPRTRFAWLSYLTSLLMISGVLTSVAGAVALTWAPQKVTVARTLSELDSRTSFPVLPATLALDGRSVSQLLKPLVEVISPPMNSWFGAEGPSASFGAGVLLEAGKMGYLFATARHVVGEPERGRKDQAFVTLESGAWAAAEIVGRHQRLDLALLWLPREANEKGKDNFILPVARRSDIEDGENVFVIGHPQGLRFTLSTGIVSRADEDTVQISAPISPGNSGGPVFDDHGNLVAIVTSKLDRNTSPNAENLNFAAPAAALLSADGWSFSDKGSQRMREFLALRSERKEHSQ